MSVYKHKELTHTIIGCAMKVHTILGTGFQEVLYQRALEIELKEAGVLFAREIKTTVTYKGHEIGTRRADFIVQGKVMVELKAVSHLDDVHLTQAINYLEAYRLETGLLINFGAKSLEFRRVINSKKKILGVNESAPST